MIAARSLGAADLIALVRDARARTRTLVEGLSEAQWMGPYLGIVNPPRWEIGHVSFFYEIFVLGELGLERPVAENGAELFDSFDVDHPDRWELPLPSPERVLAYHDRIEEMLVERIESREPGELETYLYLLGVFHEDMHGEALTYTRQTHGYPPPAIAGAPELPPGEGGPLPGDVEIPGATLALGATPEELFVFDNEKWAHPVEVASFRIARAPVTNAELAAFVEDGGYRRQELWDARGWRWRVKESIEHPVYWRQGGGRWQLRAFDQWRELPPHAPAIHVSWHEARAYCRWAGRRLPTEAEWELAASCEPAPGGGVAAVKRRYPWGDAPPGPERANLDGARLGCIDVGALPAGDSALGCRQMFGNVWEWTDTAFYPYPGFVLDRPYREYSAPWFGYPKVLRGGAWATRSRLLRNTYRNFYDPWRRDVFAGFRTCALD
jgi:iron(II)-dependent oxidoreductase